MNIGNPYAQHGKIETEILSCVVAQFAPLSAMNWEDVDKNVSQICSYLDQASAGFPGFDLFVSPECALQGFYPGVWPKLLLDIDGPQIHKLREKCKELGVWGIFNPWIKPKDGRFCENTAIMINDQGEIVHKYVKMNPWVPGEPTNPGTSFPVTPGPKGSMIGTVICADGDYPEVFREAAANGANIIVRVSHYMAPFNEAMQLTNRCAAYVNQCYVVSCDTAGVDEYYNYFGESMIINPDGTPIVKAPTGIPYIIKADLYPGIIDHMKKYSVHGNPLSSYKARGAACPDLDGTGLKGGYTAYKGW